MTKPRINMHIRPSAITWWNNLSLEDKQKYKTHFENVRINTLEQFPSMYDLRHLRISQLSEKQITRIWVFKDYKLC